jgi:hypothetical protein
VITHLLVSDEKLATEWAAVDMDLPEDADGEIRVLVRRSVAAMQADCQRVHDKVDGLLRVVLTGRGNLGRPAS